jgi:hypothetical protein
MSKRATITMLTIVGLTMLLYFSNPGEKKHIQFLENKFKIQITWNKGADSFAADDGSQFIYNNYYFFSTTTSTDKTKKRTSIGFLWIVY